ncbi:MAG: FeoA domain-containing protein [Syntrophobacter sp.]
MSANQNAFGLFGVRKESAESKSVPLSKAPNHKLLKVVQIRGNRDLCGRVAALGIQLGVLIKVRRMGSSSSCLALVSKSKQIISLSGEITEKIHVIYK